MLILIADAGLNWYFVRTVQERLLNQHGLHKYAPLIAFNTKLLVVSVLMDVMIIGLLFLPNPIVYIQYVIAPPSSGETLPLVLTDMRRSQVPPRRLPR